jgi:hypothetical protein
MYLREGKQTLQGACAVNTFLHTSSNQIEDLAGLQMRCKGMFKICDQETSQ